MQGRAWKKQAVWLPVFLVLVVCLRLTVVGVFYVQSNSMQPNIAKGDGVLVNLLAYGLHLPWQQDVVWQWSMPQRGDVIVFRNAHDKRSFWLKRVVALPGDRIAFHEHRLWLNGKAVHHQGNMEIIQGAEGERAYAIWSSWLEGGWAEVAVPQGFVFVMGDHRGASIDSRTWGVLPLSDVYGKAVFRFWPLSRAGRL